MKAQPSKAQPSETQPELVEIAVDGETFSVPKGKNLLEALLDVGEDVSYFCYHPRLSIVAKCRQCLVGLGDGHKLVPACQMTVQEGMKVRSKTEQVREARQAILEFTLLNHPLDCVICDKAGECTLQRQYMDWDGEASLVNHDKVSKPKKVDLGPDIVLDAERCILCDRCVRFMAEVAKAPQLLFAKRGDHTEVSCAPGEQLDHPYALNVADICPVGALTDKSFRFQSRVWDLWSTRTVCQGCAAGCDMELHHKDGDVYRQVPPKRWDLNLNWMCNDGRRTYRQLLEKERVTHPSLGGERTDPDTATTHIAEALQGLIGAEGSPIGVVLGADVSNEDAYAGARIAQVLGARLYLGDRPDDGKGDDILRLNDPNPNRAGVRAMANKDLLNTKALAEALNDGALKALLVVGDGLDLPAPAQRKLNALDLVVLSTPFSSALIKKASVVLPAAAWTEIDGTCTNAAGEVKRMRPAFEPPSHARPHWDWLVRLGVALDADLGFLDAEGAFSEMSANIETFAGASWGDTIPTQRLRFSGRRG